MLNLRSILNKIKYLALLIITLYLIVILFSLTNLPTSNLKEVEKNNEIQVIEHNEHAGDNIISSSNIGQGRNVELQWSLLSSDVYVLAAYLDIRKAQYFIRFLTVISQTSAKHRLSCKFGDSVITAISYEFNENHQMPFGGFIHSCPVSREAGNLSDVVFMDETSGKSLTLKLSTLRATAKPDRSFAVCVPPLFGNVNEHSLIAFMEMNKILGADHFFFYNLDIQNEKVVQLLQHYVNVGVATVMKWNIPVKNIWYNGQMTNIHHCLYQTVGSFQYTIFQDLDELIVPMVDDNWHGMMKQIDNNKHCGYKISSVFIESNKQPMMYMESQMRHEDVNFFRSKCIVRPELIFEQGIHHISKQNVEEFTPKSANPKFVLLFHYRSCDPMFNFNCAKPKIKELRLQKYSDEFHRRYYDALKSL